MAREIFRKDALRNLSNPDRTDAAIRLVGPSGWLILAALLVTMALGVVWAFQTTAPVKVRANGILIDQAGLVELSAEQGGRLQALELTTGDVIQPGQIIARLSRAELRRELTGAQAELEDRKQRYSQIERTFQARGQREAFADQMRVETLEQTRQAMLDRIALLTERAEKLAPLARRKVVPQLRLIEAQIAVSDAEERLMVLDEDRQKIALEEAERASQRDLKLLEEQLAIEETTRRIDRIEARLEEERVIRATAGGRVVEIKVNAGDVIAAGGALATLSPLQTDRDLLALMYVPPADGKRVEPGMTAEIVPTTVEQEVYGHILGEVVSVSALPATPEGMRRVLQNDQLVEQLSLGGAPIEVRVRLNRNEIAATGFEWSVSGGPVGGVNAGTLLAGKLLIGQRPLPDLAFPGMVSTVRRWLGMEQG